MMIIRLSFFTVLWSFVLLFIAPYSTIAKDSKYAISPMETEKILSRQSRTITGTITDANRGVLPGITVSVKGANVSAASGADGKYKIDIPSGLDTLVFSSVGYLTQKIGIARRTVVDVSMILDNAGLDEVVVVGFGKQKKESVVASVATIKGEELRMPNRSLSNNLAGQLPGLIAVQRSGEPGYDNSEFWIRGVSSFAGGTNPLILVDGVPRQMNDIEPDEIETFTLLKDAAATSVYGSEGANGVILITSKRGRIQKPSISYRGEVSQSSPTRIPQFGGSYDFLSLWNEMRRNDGEPEEFDAAVLQKYLSGEDRDLYPNTNWWDVLMKDHTYNNRHTLNFRGGSERVRYFVSGAYFGETGLYVNSDEYNNNAGLRRYNLRSNIDIDISKTTLLSVDLSGQYLLTNYPRSTTYDLIRWFTQVPPYLIPHKYSDGTLASLSGTFVNPYNLLVESGYRKEWRFGIQSKVSLDQKLNFIVPGLKFRGAASFDSNSQYNMSRSKIPAAYYAEGRNPDGGLIYTKVQNETPLGNSITTNTGDKNIYLEAAINYDQTFGAHTVGGMALYYQKDRQLSDNALAYRKQAYIGRAAYSFDRRYFVEGNFSFTGSEQFAEGYRFGFFPALGLAWSVTNEPFFPEELKNVLSSLKFRASVGKTGNDNTGGERFMYRPTFGSGTGYSWGIGNTGALNSISGLIEGRFEAPYLSWEIERKTNYGIDMLLFNGKINIQADYFDNKRSNILMQRNTVAGAAGFRETPWQNYGVVNNKGIDGSLNVKQQFGNVGIALRGNFTYARNKILEMDEVPQPYPWMVRTGTRLNSLPGLVAERLFREDDFNISMDQNGSKAYTLRDGIAPFSMHPNPKPGDIKYVDQNGDGIVDMNLDVVRDYVNPTVPEIIYGFGANVDYKGFYVNVFFQGAGNVSLNLNNQPVFFQPFADGLTRSSVRKEIVESRWTEENPSQNVFYPRLSYNDRSNTNPTNNTWWYRNAAFIRLKNVELGYNFTTDLMQKIKIKSMRLYVMGQNIAVWDKVKMFDPELGSQGAGTQYPIPSVWTAGLDFTF
ncbi:TonB-dependent receptor [Pedobacter sp. ASV1-7]|uniref:SusC/RagA family TonB-linked outer membrane protein n=1 Tax=Pedobacter sp. ASV1-7 TaxID=3145237 RepID=UPI0032E85378